MKEIGEKLRDSRESHGVSIEEAAEDLKIRPTQLKNLEDGNITGFKDIFYVKYFVRDYAKYLGLDGEKILDDFNEFLFDYTSRIPLDKIKEASKEKEEEPKKIVSPYTVTVKRKKYIPDNIIYVMIVIVIIVIGYLIACTIKNTGFKSKSNKDVAYKYIIE